LWTVGSGHDYAVPSAATACSCIPSAFRTCHGEHVAARASVRQSKTKRPVTFEITPTTRKSLEAWIKQAGLKPGAYLFPSRVDKAGHLSTRQYSRIVKDWARIIGEDPPRYGMHSLRRTRVTILYRQTHNLRPGGADPARSHQDREYGALPWG